MSAYLGELIGTMILVILGAGVCAGVNLNRSNAQASGWIVIVFGWGFAVAMAVYAVGKFSGAYINPAVTIAFAAIGELSWSKVFGFIVCQMIGAILGAIIVYLHYLPHWKATEDPAAKLGVFSTGPAIPHTFSNILSEIIGTFVLVLGILSIGANKFTEGLNPLIVGFLIVAIGLSLGGTTGYAINPARDLGPRIAHAILPISGKGDSNWPYAWIPVVGPILGGLFGAYFYKAMFHGAFNAGFWVTAVIIIAVVMAAFVSERKIPSSRYTKAESINTNN